MSKTTELIETWRRIGPLEWASGPYGWLDVEGVPVQLTDWQAVVLAAWWQHRAEISTIAISNIKKSGKTTLNAILTCWRWLCLPSRHFCAANDLDQSSSLVFSMIAEAVKRNPYLKANTKINSERLTFVPTGSTLEALSVDATGNAGANFLTSSHTEAWGIVLEGAIRSYEELTPPPGKVWGFPSLRIVDSYAGYLDESVTWHNLVDRGLKGKRLHRSWGLWRAEGLLLFHMVGLEAQKRCFRGTVVERERYYADQQTTLRVNSFSRLHLNERSTNESRFVDADDWQACFNKDLERWKAEDTRTLVLGADASTSRDYTSLVGCDYDGEAVGVPYVKVWQPVRGVLRGGRATIDLEATIGQEVLDLAAAGRVRAVVCDPYQLHTLVIQWERAGIKVIELAQNAGRVESDQALYDAIMSRSLRHANHKDLNTAIQNAVAVETSRGLRLAKEKAAKKIDAAVALSMAHWGALQKLVAIGEATTMRNIFAPEFDMRDLESDTHLVMRLPRVLLTTQGMFKERPTGAQGG